MGESKVTKVQIAPVHNNVNKICEPDTKFFKGVIDYDLACENIRFSLSPVHYN